MMDATILFICDIPEPADDWNDERSHLVVEDDNGKPFISGCDCVLAEDHYAQ